MKKNTTRKYSKKNLKNKKNEALQQLVVQFDEQKEVTEKMAYRKTARPLEAPSSEALQRYALIPLYFHKEKEVTVIKGKIAYDSWAQSTPVALRDTTDGYLRRLHLKARNLSLEIVAERRQNQWEFVARLYSGDKVIQDFVLQIGRLKILPLSGGFYQWTTRKVPATVKLLSYDKNIVFDRLSWH